MAAHGKIAVITGAGSGIGRATGACAAGGRLDRRARRPPRATCSKRPRRLAECAAAAHPGGADRRPRPGVDRGAVRGGQADLRPHRPVVQQRRHQHPRHPVRGSDLRAMVECRRGQPDRLVPVRAARLPHDEGAGPARRPHHQQRLGLGACAAAQLDPLCRDQARADRADPVAVARRARTTTSPAARSTSATPRPTRNEDTARGRLQATGQVEAEARIDVQRRRQRRRSTWPACRSKPTCCS